MAGIKRGNSFGKGFPVGEYFLLLLPGYDIKLIFYLLGIYFFLINTGTLSL